MRILNPSLISKSLGPSLLFLFFIFISSASGSLQEFTGIWQNRSPANMGIASMEISRTGRGIQVRAWAFCPEGKCHLGESMASPHVNSGKKGGSFRVHTLTASFQISPGDLWLVIRKNGPNGLRVETFHRYTHDPPKSLYHQDYFTRDMIIAGPASTVTQVPEKEDCIPFDHKTITIKKKDGKWNIISGSHIIMGFKWNRGDAVAAYKAIKRYKMDSICFSGKGFTYFLSGGFAPCGEVTGERCLPLEHAGLEIKKGEKGWEVFHEKLGVLWKQGCRPAAEFTLEIIRKHGFSHMCSIGSSGETMNYLKRKSSSPENRTAQSSQMLFPRGQESTKSNYSGKPQE